MSYSTSKPGIDEGRLLAIQAALIAKLGDLNLSLARSNPVAQVQPVDASHILLGDPNAGWSNTASGVAGGDIRICVVGGGQKDGQDFESELVFNVTETCGFKYTLSTNIYMYVHPDALPNTDPFVQAAQREIVRARLCDWVRSDVFNNPAGMALALQSQEYNTGAQLDYLFEGYIHRGYKGFIYRNFGGSTAYLCAHMVHVGVIQ